MNVCSKTFKEGIAMDSILVPKLHLLFKTLNSRNKIMYYALSALIIIVKIVTKRKLIIYFCREGKFFSLKCRKTLSSLAVKL